jgi:hypothetical protein
MIGADPKTPPVDAGRVPWSSRANPDSVVALFDDHCVVVDVEPGIVAATATDSRPVAVMTKTTTMSAAW